MFSYGSSSSISLATDTPSLVTVGAPNFLSRSTFLPLGPRVTLTASEIVSTPTRSFRRASSLNNNCFAIPCSPELTVFLPATYTYINHKML